MKPDTLRNLCLSFIAVMLIGLTLQSCTVSQAVAGGNYVAGAQLVTVALQRSPESTPALQHLANILPDIVSGKADPFDLGVLNAQLQPIFVAAETERPQNKSIYVNIGQLISSASKLNGSNPTAYQGIAIAAAIDFQNGLNDGLKFNAGRSSVTDPPAVAAAANLAPKAHKR